jgi:hypothetical protein
MVFVGSLRNEEGLLQREEVQTAMATTAQKKV